MFFIGGIHPKRKELEYYQTMICSCCSKYGRYEVFMECSVFSLFFIPLIKFNKKYYAKTTCCNSLYLIKNQEKAMMLEKGQGQNVTLTEYDLEPVYIGSCYSKMCPSCGYELSENYNYCPNCGTNLS